jgi:MFS family permease
MVAQSLKRRLFALVILHLLVCSAAASWWSLHLFEPALQPELEAKAGTVGRAIAAQLARALDAGVPLEKLVGVDSLFQETMRTHAEIAFLAVTDPPGSTLYHRTVAGQPPPFQPVDDTAFDDGRTGRGWIILNGGSGPQIVVPVITGAHTAALLRVGVDGSFIGRVQSQILVDVLTVLLVACLATVEVVVVVTAATTLRLGRWKELAAAAAEGRFASLPVALVTDSTGKLVDWYARAVRQIRQVSGQTTFTGDAVFFDGATLAGRDVAAFNITGMRLAVFLFVLGEEMIRPFLPLHARELAAGTHIPTNWIAAAPIGVFMMIWAFSQLFGPGLSNLLGGRPTFGLSAFLSALSMVMMAAAQSFSGLMMWRCLEALGYGMALFSAQNVVLSNSSAEGRSAGFAAYIGGILTAGVCGPALGGVAAEQLGTIADFLIGGMLFAGSVGVFYGLTQREETRAKETGVMSRRTLTLFSSRRMVSILGLSGLPNRLATTAILFYIFPLYLTAIGVGKAAVGRVLLLYYVGFILSTPIAVRLADLPERRLACVVAGGVVSGAVCLIFLFHPPSWLAGCCCLLLGLAQGPSTLQPSMLTATCRSEAVGVSEGAALAVFRFAERIGSSMAPFLAAALAGIFGYGGAAIGLGGLLALASIALLMVYRTPDGAAAGG